MLTYFALKRLSAFMLITSLLLSFSSAYAQSSRQSSAPPRTIDFAGVTYDLAIEESKETFNFGKWHYRPKLPGPQQSHLPELILTWRSDEWISDTFDEDTCPPISENYHKHRKENTKPPFLHVVAYEACMDIYKLRNEFPGFRVIKIHEDERNGEILIAHIITGGEVEQGEFVKLTISRYIPVSIDHPDDFEGMLHYAYVITAYGPSQEQAGVLLEKLNQEGEQWLNGLFEAPVPQFILDRAKYYERCTEVYGDKSGDHCPW